MHLSKTANRYGLLHFHFSLTLGLLYASTFSLCGARRSEPLFVCQVAMDIIQEAVQNLGSDVRRLIQKAGECPQRLVFRAGIVTMGGEQHMLAPALACGCDFENELVCLPGHFKSGIALPWPLYRIFWHLGKHCYVVITRCIRLEALTTRNLRGKKESL